MEKTKKVRIPFPYLLRRGKIFFVLMLAGFSSHAQTESLYSSYLFNGLSINPAYAGYKECLNVNLWGRTQWQGIEGAPSSIMFSAHTPLPNKKMAVGLNISRESYGVTRQTGAGGIYAYRLPINKKYTLSSGIQTSVLNVSSDYSGLAMKAPGDPMFSQNENRFFMDLAAGFFLSSSKLFCSVSATHLQQNIIRSSKGNNALRRQYLFSSGYLIQVSKDVKLKPSVLVRATEGSGVQGDINLNLLIREVLWTGLSVRTNGSFIVLTQMKLNPSLDLGYALDHSTLGSQRNYVSHELMLNYRFVFRKTDFITPRYF